MVDLAARCIHVHREPARAYQSVEKAGEGAVVRPQAFPDLAIEVSRILPG